MSTFTLLTKAAQLACGDLHLVSERTELWTGHCSQTCKVFFFIAPNCLSVSLFYFPIHYPLSPLLREGHLGTKPAAPRPPLIFNPTSTLHLLHLSLLVVPQDLGCPGPCLSRFGCTLFLRGGGLRFRLRVGMVVV